MTQSRSQKNGRWNWVGIDAQYFNITMLNTDQKSLANNINAVADGAEIPSNSREQRLVDCTSLLFEKFDVPAGGSVKRSFQVFAGPKEKEILTEYGLDDNRALAGFGGARNRCCGCCTCSIFSAEASPTVFQLSC